MALGTSGPDSAETIAVTEKIASAARKAGKPICVMVGSGTEAGKFRGLGASAFIVSSDQGLMRQAAAKVAHDFAEMQKTASAAR